MSLEIVERKYQNLRFCWFFLNKIPLAVTKMRALICQGEPLVSRRQNRNSLKSREKKKNKHVFQQFQQETDRKTKINYFNNDLLQETTEKNV